MRFSLPKGKDCKWRRRADWSRKRRLRCLASSCCAKKGKARNCLHFVRALVLVLVLETVVKVLEHEHEYEGDAKS